MFMCWFQIYQRSFFLRYFLCNYIAQICPDAPCIGSIYIHYVKHGQEGHVGKLYPTNGSYARFHLSCVEVVFPTQKLVERKMEGNFMVFFNGQDCSQRLQLICFF